MLPVTDPAVLGAICSGVLLVVSVDGRTRRADFTAAERTVTQVGARLLGLVVNRLPVQRRAKTYYNYEPSAPVSESPRRSSRARRTPEDH
jgi:Mrp family chromosome partitioning ATPase